MKKRSKDSGKIYSTEEINGFNKSTDEEGKK
jgi:hypothetical protein